MSFDLNDLLDRGGALAGSAKKTAADLAQRGRRQLELTAAQSRLSKAQRQLGALVYSLACSGVIRYPFYMTEFRKPGK